MPSHRSRRVLAPSGPRRSSQRIRSAHRRPSRSMAAMSGRPVVEPRTGRPGRAAPLLFLDAIDVPPRLRFGYRNDSLFRIQKQADGGPDVPNRRRLAALRRRGRVTTRSDDAGRRSPDRAVPHVRPEPADGEGDAGMGWLRTQQAALAHDAGPGTTHRPDLRTMWL